MTEPTDKFERQMWKVDIAAPIETVWATLVRTDAVLPFMFGAICEAGGALAPGRPFRMLAKDRKSVVAVGQVLEFSPPFRFSHTISFTQVEGEQPGRTTYELREIDGGTELSLVSEALPGTKTAKMAASGPFIVDNLKRLVETGKPAFSGSMVMALSPLASLFTPKISRIENWPLGRL